MEQNNCPKPDCGRPESTHRWSTGKKLSICGNGHTWDQQEIAAQRAKAKEAEIERMKRRILNDFPYGEYQEIKIEYRPPSSDDGPIRVSSEKIGCP